MSTASLIHKRIRKHVRDLDNSDQKVSARAEGYLIRYYGARALEALNDACSHPHPQVRFRSVWALAYTHEPRVYDTILRLTQDPEGSLRYDEAIALGILGDERALAPLVALMQQRDLEGAVDGAAAMGLVRLGT